MLRNKALRLHIAGAAVFALLFGTSAFAESRHHSGTRGGSSPSHSSPSHSWSRGSGSSSHSFFGGHSRGGSAPRFDSRSFGSRGSSGRSFSGRSSGSRGFGSRGSAPQRIAPAWRGGRGGSFGGRGFGHNTPFRGYNSGSHFFGRGRVDRIVPYHGGYHIYLGGWGYPFFVPYRYWNPFHFRVGLFIGLNAFYDPLGYYNVYDPWYYPYPPPAVVVERPGYRAAGAYSDGNEYGSTVVRGTVQTVDLPRDTMWVNDETSHKVITVLMPPDRQLNGVRAGDYVEVSGDWKSDGVFDAHAL